MWFKKNTTNNNKNILYLSIDGRSVGIALYTDNICHFSDRRIHIHGENQKPIEYLLKDILYAFKHSSHNKAFDEIIVIMETPWVKEVSLNLKEKRTAPFEINQNIIEKIINKDTDSKELDLVYNHNIASIVEQVTLNGYAYPNPLGKLSNQLEIYLTKYMADKTMIDFINKEISEFWNKTPITYKAGSLFIYDIGKKLKASNDMYVTLGANDTIIHLYSMGRVSEKITIPWGLQNMLKILGAKWNTASSETFHWLDLFLNKTLNETEQARIEGDIRTAILPYIESLNIANNNKVTFLIERQITIFGAEEIWNKLFIFLLQGRFFGGLFPNIDRVKIIDIANNLKDLKGDRLIATYVRMNELTQ